MRVLKLCSFLVLVCISNWGIAQTTPYTPGMGSGSNAAVFGANNTLGTDIGTTFYLTWDNTYIYFGFDGGQTNYNGCSGQSSDMYFVAIDTNNDGGTSGAIEGIGFAFASSDYYTVYENNEYHYGAPSSLGNAQEIYVASGGSGWSWQSRIQDPTVSGDAYVSWLCSGAEMRHRVAWSDLSFTPGPGKPIAFTFWRTDDNLSDILGSWPSDNPTGTGASLSHKLFFPSTGSGVTPASAGTSVPLATALPIELISFDATTKGESVELDWATAAEMNNSHFTIEHAIDGKDFYAIGHVEGAGESTELLRYAYTHEQPAVGTNYYRLAQYDYDGTVSYSEIEMVRIGSGTTSVQVFPNPTKDQITIQIDEPVFTGSIQVYDVHGSLVAQQGSRSNTTFDMNTETWEAGIYQLVICPDRGDCITKTIIKQ